MHIIKPLVVGALLAATSTAFAAPSGSARGEADLAKMLAGRVAGGR